MRLSARQVMQALVALAMGGMAIVAVMTLDDWVGDWIGPVWLLSPFLAAFLVELALGRRATGTRGIVIGVAIGVGVVALPSAGYMLAEAANGTNVPDLIEKLQLAKLWAVFLPLGALEGGLWGSLGASSGVYLRERRSRPAE
jgi:hypothetical protein